MAKTYNLSTDQAAVSFSLSRVDEQVLQVILDRVYPQRSPFEEISSLAELMRDSERTILLRRINFWSDSEKPRSAPREALREEVMAALSHLERDLAAFTCAYSMSCNTTISVQGQEMPLAASGSGPARRHQTPWRRLVLVYLAMWGRKMRAAKTRDGPISQDHTCRRHRSPRRKITRHQQPRNHQAQTSKHQDGRA